MTHARAQVFFVALLGCKSPVPADSKDGPALFAAYCASCHGPDGRPPAAMVARLGVKDLTSAEIRKKATPAFVESQIRNGSQNKLMPSFLGVIPEAQMQAIADWVANPAFVTPPP